jgi:hypothetical protein
MTIVYANWSDIVSIIGGVFVLLHIFGYLPINPNADDARRWMAWRRKYRISLTVVGTGLIAFGAIRLYGYLKA